MHAARGGAKMVFRHHCHVWAHFVWLQALCTMKFEKLGTRSGRIQKKVHARRNKDPWARKTTTRMLTWFLSGQICRKRRRRSAKTIMAPKAVYSALQATNPTCVVSVWPWRRIRISPILSGNRCWPTWAWRQGLIGTLPLSGHRDNLRMWSA